LAARAVCLSVAGIAVFYWILNFNETIGVSVMPITVTIDEANDLTIIEYVNMWTFDDFEAAYHPAIKVTRLKLHDHTRSDRSLPPIDREWMEKAISYQMKHRMFDRPGGKSAFVTKGGMADMLAKLIINVDQLLREDVPHIEHRVFHNRDEAMSWLLESGSCKD
jgi:hypothetical protein